MATPYGQLCIGHLFRYRHVGDGDVNDDRINLKYFKPDRNHIHYDFRMDIFRRTPHQTTNIIHHCGHVWRLLSLYRLGSFDPVSVLCIIR